MKSQVAWTKSWRVLAGTSMAENGSPHSAQLGGGGYVPLRADVSGSSASQPTEQKYHLGSSQG